MTSLWPRLLRIVLTCLLAGPAALALQIGQTVNDGIYTTHKRVINAAEFLNGSWVNASR